MNIASILCIAAIPCMVACSSSSSVISYDRYSIVDSISASAFNSDYNLKVELFEGIDDGGIVIKTSDVTLRAANNHRWSSNLDKQIAVIFKNDLNQKKVRKDLNTSIYVSKFYGSTDGNVSIDVFAKVTLGKKDFFEKSYTFYGKQSKDGYDGLVEKLKEGITSISEEFSTDLSAR